MTALETAEIVTKGEFAAAIGVSPGRVSQYIAERKIFGSALRGEGRAARIHLPTARAQLQKTLEPSQHLGGNGQAFRGTLFEPASSAGERLAQAELPARRPVAASPSLIVEPPLDDIAAERLKQMRIKTAQAERQEALERGRYMLAEAARREMGKAVGEAFKVMERGLQDMAAELAEQFSLPQRDVHHALQKAFRSVRVEAASRFRAQADSEPELVADPASTDADDEAAA
ncbi:hypothetical protein D5400_14140 [Georhizobium profundi]|uniref:Uncharacterized protein n=1 Tax=Georhizobium profundi TaxID=2341112 RepID=A0A3Q8XPD8_9HYPH|nr:hypothetical protein [Georhizobium profundi]AZN72265.1 hypothetical protein D5400_14140 [Georhizobium profundi]